jgi:hypothetical protein
MPAAPVIYIPRPRLIRPPLYSTPRARRPLAFPAIIHGAAAVRGLSSLNPQQASIANAAASAASTTGVLIGVLAGIPVAGPIAAAIAAVGVLLANVFSGCGQTCVQASNLANQAEPLLLQNLQTYLSAPVRYASMQAAALNNFALTWNALTQACSNPALGSAGQACISDRQAGACHYQTSPGGWSQVNGTWQYTYPGAAGSGSTCWNWFVGYHDPIANDPGVQPDPTPASSAASGLLSTFGVNPTSTFMGIPLADLALPAILLFGALLL